MAEVGSGELHWDKDREEGKPGADRAARGLGKRPVNGVGKSQPRSLTKQWNKVTPREDVKSYSDQREPLVLRRWL